MAKSNLDGFTTFKMAGILELVGHKRPWREWISLTWIGSPPSRWRGSWNTWATRVAGMGSRRETIITPVNTALLGFRFKLEEHYIS
jgi:hypothetical protein